MVDLSRGNGWGIFLLSEEGMKYIKGDVIKAAQQNEEGVVILPHICNDAGKWGKGFVLELSKVWKEPEAVYKDLTKELGQIQVAMIDGYTNPGILVVNMIAQKGVRRWPGQKPIRYKALESCMERVLLVAEDIDLIWDTPKIFAPKFGSGLAGGDWERIEELIETHWKSLDVTIFEKAT